MADVDLHTFLQKEIIESGKTLTYRLLSRKLGIGVNAAKDALASYYAEKRASCSAVYATYLLCGSVLSPEADSKTVEEESMDVDGDASQQRGMRMSRFMDADVMEFREPKLRKIMLVAEDELENVKSTLDELVSLHIYSLSPTRITDAQSLTAPINEVWKIDASKGTDLIRSTGRVFGEDTKPFERGGTLSNQPFKVEVQASPELSGATTKEKVVKKEEKSETRLSLASTEKIKPKATSKLDWSKAKIKEVKKEPSLSDRDTNLEGARHTETSEPRAKKVKQGETEEEKKTLVSSKAEHSKTPERSIVEAKTRAKNGVIMSDDEEEETTSRNAVSKHASRRKGKSRASPTDDETETDADRSLRAMMDIDDAEIINASKLNAPSAPPTSGEEDSDVPPTSPEDALTAADTSMDIDKRLDWIDEKDSDLAHKSKIKVKPRKRKEKEVIPVGRNGLPKKRVEKTKTDLDDKGYTVTTDYFEYESVDEEEAEAETEQQIQKKKDTKKSKQGEQRNKQKPSDAVSKKSLGSTKSRSTGATAGQSKRQKSQSSLNSFLKKA